MQKTYYLVSGGFDPIHEGHIAMIKASATASDGVIVLLNSDEWLTRKKGKPFMTFKTRKVICENLKGVIDVIAFNDDDDSASDGIRLAREKYIDCRLVFANGGDRHSGNIRETDACIKYQVDLAFGVGGEEKLNASSWILKRWYNTANKQQRKILYTLKLYLVRCLCCLIPVKTLRHNIRSTLMDVRFSDISSYLRFNYRSIPGKSVLLIEANNTHGEVLPGYVAYFQELGYQVAVVLNANLSDSHPLCRVASKLNIFPASETLLKHLLASPRLHCYTHLLVTTSCNYNHRANNSTLEPMFIVEKYPLLQRHQSLLVVEHELNNLLTDKENTVLQQNHLLTLGNFAKGLMVNPHDFGKIITHKQLHSPTNFIVVGAINSQRKNHTALLIAINQLHKLQLNFKVTIIGRGSIEFISPELQPYVDYKGVLDFRQMYLEMEHADFFLPLLDADDPQHNRYITTGVTGSAQLIYGFLTPAIIQAKFADFYRFNQHNSIIYQHDLAAAMQIAIEMNEQDYQHLQQALATTVQAIKTESIANLKLACNNNR